MRVLLDTNILIHREAAIVIRQNIGLVFSWLDRLGYEKYVHPLSVEEIEQHKDEQVRNSFKAKIASYHVMKAHTPLTPEIAALSAELDSTKNSINDSRILNELVAQRADLLITEDRGIYRKAKRLGIADRVFTIDGFLEKAFAENPDFIHYKVLSVQKTLFGEVNLKDPFFDSFREDYSGFDLWFNRKSEEPAYICFEDEKVVAFLYLKTEDQREPYADISPPFRPKKRLKIGTFKVELNGFKLGERFLKIVFDNAIKQRVEEIYVTIFARSAEQERLIKLIEDFGFVRHGNKNNAYGNEQVYVRDMSPRIDLAEPCLTFPFISRSARAFLVPIYPEYHTNLLPDSILNTESQYNFIEHEPYRNAIQKVYISRSYFKNVAKGDIIIFYRTGGYYKSVITTLGIVENVYTHIPNEDQFIQLCRKRSVFTDDELRKQWRYQPQNRPFIVEFLYAYSFPKRPNMAALIEHNVIKDIKSAPRGFERISSDQFEKIISLSETDTRFIIS